MNQTSLHSTPVLVVGWDSAAWNYLRPLLEQHAVPTIEKLIAEGTAGPLLSVDPPQTPAAWPSFATGTCPPTHGVYGWWSPDPITYELRWANARMIQRPMLWQWLGQAGKRVGVMNVPLTYPAAPVNGFLVCGFDSPFREPDWTEGTCYPTDVLARLGEDRTTYRTLCHRPDTTDLEAHLQDWLAMEQHRTDVACKLIKQERPDFMMIVFHMADYFQHRTARESSTIRRVYKALDGYLAQLMACYPEGVSTFVVSDHGAIEVEKFVYIHNWLEQENFLAFKPVLAERRLSAVVARLLMTRPGTTLEEISAVTRAAKQVWAELPIPARQVVTDLVRPVFPGCCMSQSNIDWSRTRAFTVSNYGQIYVNLKGRQVQGIVEPGLEYVQVINQIQTGLRDLTDADTGQRIFEDVYLTMGTPEAAMVSHAPDITCRLADYRYYVCSIYPYHLYTKRVIGPRPDPRDAIDDTAGINPVDDKVGDHTMEGILIAHGPTIACGQQIQGARLIDVAPTLLHLLEVSIPACMEGRVLGEIFESFDPAAVRVSAELASFGLTATDDRDSSFDETVAAELKAKLRELGYRI